MAQVIIDVRQWQSMFDLRTGQKLEDDTPTIRMIQGLLDRHPYPGDIDIQSNRWVSDAALDLISIYEPRLVCLSYAQQYFSSRFSQLTQQEYKDQLGQVFTEVERFVEESGYTPVIVGTGDMTELEGEMDLSRLDGLAMSSAWSARYAGLIEHSERDLEYVKGLPHMERIVSRDEWTSLFEGIPHNPEDIPDYLLVADPGWTFRTATTSLRRAVRIPGENFTVPVATDLGVVDDITSLRGLIEQNLENTRIALIVIEGVGMQNFLKPHMPCSNGKGWFYYEPGESQYLTAPSPTPARSATSSSRVAAKPFSTNSPSAAAVNSDGRASLRRFLGGFATGMSELMTDWSLIYHRSFVAVNASKLIGPHALPFSCPSSNLDPLVRGAGRRGRLRNTLRT